jgi:hypothetical protein
MLFATCCLAIAPDLPFVNEIGYSNYLIHVRFPRRCPTSLTVQGTGGLSGFSFARVGL